MWTHSVVCQNYGVVVVAVYRRLAAFVVERELQMVVDVVDSTNLELAWLQSSLVGMHLVQVPAAVRLVVAAVAGDGHSPRGPLPPFREVRYQSRNQRYRPPRQRHEYRLFAVSDAGFVRYVARLEW